HRRLNQSTTQWLAGQQKFTDAFGSMWQRMAETAINAMLQLAAQEAIQHALHVAIVDQEKLIEAKTAARTVFTKVLQALPFPADVIVAPAAAAVAFAAVISSIKVVSFYQTRSRRYIGKRWFCDQTSAKAYKA